MYYTTIKLIAFIFISSVLFSCNSIPKETQDKALVIHNQMNSSISSTSSQLISCYDSISAVSANVFSGINIELGNSLQTRLRELETFIEENIVTIEKTEELDTYIPYKANTIKSLTDYKNLIVTEYTNLLKVSTAEMDPEFISRINSIKLAILKKLIEIETNVVSNREAFCNKYSIENNENDKQLLMLQEGLSQLEYNIESLKRVLEMKE